MFLAISEVKVRLISAANREARGMMGLKGIAGVRFPRVPQIKLLSYGTRIDKLQRHDAQGAHTLQAVCLAHEPPHREV